MLLEKQHWSNSPMESPEKHFRDSHIRGCEQQWQDLLGQRQRTAPRYPFSLMIRRFSSLSLQKSLLWASDNTCTCQTRRAKTQRCRTSLCLTSPSEHPLPRHDGAQAVTGTVLGPAWLLQKEHTKKPSPGLWYLWLYSLGLGERRLSFKLTNLFPNSLWACAVPSPYPIPLQIFRGSLPYWTLSWFSQATLLPFRRAFWQLLRIPQRRNFSLTGSPMPGSLRGWAGRSPGSLVLANSRIPSIWPAMGLSPRESGTCSFRLNQA